MAQITSDTTYGDIQIGDTFPEGIEAGGEVVGAITLPSSIDPQRKVITLTVRHKLGVRSHEHSTGAMWADETVGAAVKRSEFMSALVDHS